MVMLRAYFDESGSHKDSPILAIAGAVAPERAWEPLEPKWQKILDEFVDKGVKEFHMYDCIHGFGQFTRIEEPFRKYIIRQLTNIIIGTNLSFISSSIRETDFNTIRETKDTYGFNDPMSLCFSSAMADLEKWSIEHADGDPIAVVFDQTEENGPKIEKIARLYSEYPRKIIKSLAFASREDCIPLQVADMLVYQVRYQWGLKDPMAEVQFLGEMLNGKFNHITMLTLEWLNSYFQLPRR
jgi:Protein of unknown function (DUF3800)